MAPAMPIVAAYRGELDWFTSHGPSRAGARIVLLSLGFGHRLSQVLEGYEVGHAGQRCMVLA